MAYDFLKSIHSAALEKEFNARPAKPAKDPMPARRANVIAGIDRALADLKAGKDKGERGSYVTKPNTDVVKFHLKYGTRKIALGGQDTFYTKDAPAAYSELKKQVQAGALDDAIRATIEGNQRVGATRGDSATRAPRKQRNETPEQKAARTAKRLATIAAKKAAQGG